MHRNLSLDDNHITAGEVHILRVLPGEVGLIRAQGTEVLLNVGTHVFNSGTVTIVGKVSYSDQKYFHHGRFHYVRVERGYFAKVWTVVSVDGVETVVPRVRNRCQTRAHALHSTLSFQSDILLLTTKLLGQGVHYIDNVFFKFDRLHGFVKCSEKVIEHGR